MGEDTGKSIIIGSRTEDGVLLGKGVIVPLKEQLLGCILCIQDVASTIDVEPVELRDNSQPFFKLSLPWLIPRTEVPESLAITSP